MTRTYQMTYSFMESQGQSMMVFERLHNNGLTLNGNKFEFRKDKMAFFGVVIRSNGIPPDPNKIKAVK